MARPTSAVMTKMARANYLALSKLLAALTQPLFGIFYLPKYLQVEG
jgi:hypothetical protein